MIGDINVLIVLIAKRFIFAAVVSSIVILSAIVVCYAPLVNFFIERGTI
jgi:hypothetical protein